MVSSVEKGESEPPGAAPGGLWVDWTGGLPVGGRRDPPSGRTMSPLRHNGTPGIWKQALGDAAFRRLLKPGWPPTGLDWGSVGGGKQMFPV